MQIIAKKDNIRYWLEGINQFNTSPQEGTTRILFTKEELASRDYIKAEMKKLGLNIKEDAIGNIFATLKGEDEKLPAIWTGSHIDTVPNAGMFDGMSGIVCGMEAVRIIRESKERHKRDITVIVYTSEEPTRFGLSCLGSRAMSGHLTSEDAKSLFDKDGKSLYKVLTECGFCAEKLDEVRIEKDSVYASIELHIEQNDVLYKNKKTIGIVKGICAPTNLEIVIEGVQSHAGGTSMEKRKDAYMAACEIALEVEKLARESESEYLTATVGKITVFPNAVNVIPGRVQFSVDIRSIDFEAKEVLLKHLKTVVNQIAQRRQVKAELKMNNHDRPYLCNSKIIAKLEEICRKEGISYETCISGAYHDSLFVGEIAPTAMIFVPSREGISHSKEEWTEFEDLAEGAQVLAEVLLELANE